MAVTTADVLVKYTFYGDADLNGIINGSDFTLIDNGFNSKLTGWRNGDFNYDGVVNGDDYTLIDNAYNRQGAGLDAGPSEMIADATEQISQTSAVPEPGAAALVCISGAALLARRRRLD